MILSTSQILLTLMGLSMKVRHFFSSNDTYEKSDSGVFFPQTFVGVSLRTKSEANRKGDLIRQFYL